ncbi:MAG TPA: penicillin-binding protein 1A [Gammaproteobacteria bacterium]|nr:penicillin-binding protein 1A [Gammaproteobacteria bacterium]
MKKLVKIVSWLFAAGSTLLLAVVIYIYVVLVPTLPSIDHLEDTQYQVPLRIYDRNDLLLAEFGEHRRIPVRFDKIPRYLIDAVVSVEDDQFWNHPGVDVYALMAAAYEVVTTGRKTRGGSTITMQVARNFFLSPEQTYTRKLNEILLALKIEKELNKEKIIELYLNKIFLGHRAYGISAASQVYYDKKLLDITLAQAAMIAGLPKAPSKYNPISNPQRALIRRNYILGRMRILNYITEEEFDLALNEPISAELHKNRTTTEAQYVSELVRAELFEQYGEEVYKAGLKVYTTIDGELQAVANQSLRRALIDYDRRHGYRGVAGKIDLTGVMDDPFEEDLVTDDRIGGLRKGVVIAINEAQPGAAADGSDVVDASATVLISTLEKITLPFKGGIEWAAAFVDVDNRGKEPEKVGDVLAVGDVIWLENRDSNWLLADVPAVEGALVSLNPATGGIQAMVGGFDYFKNKFNRATQARRQPGSNFKPFIYSAALEKGYTAATLINDAPVVFDDDSLESTWRPENYSGRVYGPTRLREALIKSRNLVSIRILQSIGLRFATSYIQRFGFERENMPYDLSLALGSGTYSPLQVARGYAVFSNGGYLIDPYIIERVESGNGEIIYQSQPKTVCQGCETEDLSARTAAEIALSEQADTAETEAATESSTDAATEPNTEVANDPNTEAATESNIEAANDPVADDQAVEDTGPRYAPRVITAQNAYIMRSIMREVVQRGTAVRAKVLGRKDIAGKTGTTNDQIDAWFSGYNDQVVTTAWVGFDNQRHMGRRETGGRAALPMWIDFMRVALDGMPENLQEQPEGLVTIRIDAETGKRADGNTTKSLFELFREENAPRQKAVVRSNSTTTDGIILIAPETEAEIVEDIF